MLWRSILTLLPALVLAALPAVATAQEGADPSSSQIRLVVFHGDRGISTAVSPSNGSGSAPENQGMLSLMARGTVGGAIPNTPQRDMECEMLGISLLIVGML